MLTFGFEFEVADRADYVISELLNSYRGSWIRCDELHSYHCGCDDCGIWPVMDGDLIYDFAPLFHAQADSSCGGEFITRVLDSFDDLEEASAVLTRAVRAAGASVNTSCGLHVHVSSSGLSSIVRRGAGSRTQQYRDVPVAYLLVERYISELIAPGATRNKRDMNMTLLSAIRNMIAGERAWAEERVEDWDAVRVLTYSAISNDRHVDLNVSSRTGTFEFRVFNATNHAWRINLAARLSVAFVERHRQIIEACTREFKSTDLLPIVLGHRWPTMRPRISMAEFIDIVSAGDPDLRRLMLRQCLFMRDQYRPEFDMEATEGPDEEPLPAAVEPIEIPYAERRGRLFWTVEGADPTAVQPPVGWVIDDPWRSPDERRATEADDDAAALVGGCECEYCTDMRRRTEED